MPAKRVVVLLLIFALIITVVAVLSWFSYHSSRQDEKSNILLEICSKSVGNLRDDFILGNGLVLVYNETIFARGFIREKVVYKGRHYNIVVGNGTHIAIYATSVGRFPLYSKGIFYEIHAIAIYHRDNVLRPIIIYSYQYPEYSYPKRYYFRSVTDEQEMVLEIARLPYYLPHFWIENLVKEKTMYVNTDSEEIVEMKLLKNFRASNRDLWIVKYVFHHENVNVYACVDVETGLILAGVFMGRSETSISYLEDITNIDSVPPELLTIIRNTVFIDTTTNRTLEISRP